MTMTATDIARDYPLPKRRVRWLGLIFFIILHIVAIVGTPLYIYYRGITAPEIALFFCYAAATGMSITIGYHRLFAHSTFKASPIVQFVLLFFGAATFEESALKWASQHRQHHRFTDTEHDPYGVNKGFWHAHIGWILFWRHRTNYNNVNDLRKSRLVSISTTIMRGGQSAEGLSFQCLSRGGSGIHWAGSSWWSACASFWSCIRLFS